MAFTKNFRCFTINLDVLKNPTRVLKKSECVFSSNCLKHIKVYLIALGFFKAYQGKTVEYRPQYAN